MVSRVFHEEIQMKNESIRFFPQAGGLFNIKINEVLFLVHF